MTVALDGLLRTFADAGIVEAADVHVAQRLTSLAGDTDERVALAVALAVRALRGGSVCVDVRSVEAQVGISELPWPEPSAWLTAVQASPLLGSPPVLRLHDDLLYLDRYWREEQQVADDLLALMPIRTPDVVPDIGRLFPQGYEEQREAAEVALAQGLTVLTGGPGTGKTTTVARLISAVRRACRAGRRGATAYRAGGTDRQGGGEVAGGGSARSGSPRRCRPTAVDGAEGDDPAPALG